jgi:hypothetical protein
MEAKPSVVVAKCRVDGKVTSEMNKERALIFLLRYSAAVMLLAIGAVMMPFA